MKNIIIDEMPEITEVYSIPYDGIGQALDACTLSWSSKVRPWAVSLLRKVPCARSRYMALDVDEQPDSLRIPGYGDAVDAKRVLEVFAPVKLAQDIRRAAHASAKFKFGETSVQVTRLTPIMAHWQERGGALLAAGAPRIALEALRPDLQFVQIDVEDPSGVKIDRRMIRVSDATTSKLREAPERVKTLTQDALGRASGRPMLLVCPLALEAQVRALAPSAAVAHYGAIRGLDDWMSCDVFVTLGDHFDNLGAVDAEAEYLGVDAGALSLQRVRTELEQAHGRARDCRRTRDALHLHYGHVWPNRWHRGNTTVEIWGLTSG